MADPIYIHLAPENVPRELSVGPFKAVIILEQTGFPAWRDKVCAWLVERGCLYCCVWGEDCEAWHDEVDRANIRAFDGETIPDDQFVITTWHAKESLSEALWFVGVAAEHPTVDLAQTVILHIAQNGRGSELVEQYRNALDE